MLARRVDQWQVSLHLSREFGADLSQVGRWALSRRCRFLGEATEARIEKHSRKTYLLPVCVIFRLAFAAQPLVVVVVVVAGW